MNRYNIRIGSDILPDSFTYDELKQNGVFDPEYRGIGAYVRKVGETTWTPVDSYPFPERTPSGSTPPPFHGTAGNVSQNKSKTGYTINEFGEAVKDGPSGGGGQISGNRKPAKQKGDDTGFKVFMTIFVVIVFIIITATTGWGAIPAGAVGAAAINQIWKK